MPKSIDLRRIADTAGTETFRAAIRAEDRHAIGERTFTASGVKEEKAPARAPLAGDDFTASGLGKDPRPSITAGDDFTASGRGKDQT